MFKFSSALALVLGLFLQVGWGGDQPRLQPADSVTIKSPVQGAKQPGSNLQVYAEATVAKETVARCEILDSTNTVVFTGAITVSKSNPIAVFWVSPPQQALLPGQYSVIVWTDTGALDAIAFQVVAPPATTSFGRPRSKK